MTRLTRLYPLCTPNFSKELRTKKKKMLQNRLQHLLKIVFVQVENKKSLILETQQCLDFEILWILELWAHRLWTEYCIWYTQLVKKQYFRLYLLLHSSLPSLNASGKHGNNTSLSYLNLMIKTATWFITTSESCSVVINKTINFLSCIHLTPFMLDMTHQKMILSMYIL